MADSTLIHLVLLFPVYLPLALFIGYTIGIQYERGGIWNIFVIVAFVTFLVDLLANWTILSIYMWEKPNNYSSYFNRMERTFSDRLERLVLSTGWRCKVARAISWYLNLVAPTKHIKNYF